MKSLKLLFFLCATSVFAQIPTNNECANAEVIVVSTGAPLSIAANFTEATESLDASCNTATLDNKDLWYQFVMPVDGNVFINAASSLNHFTLYSTCGGAELDCSNDDTSFGNLVNGNTYLLRTSYQFNGSSSFTVQAFETAANDECDNRETITVVTSNYIQYSTDSRTATESIDASCDNPENDNLDLWYEFVMPVNGHIEIKEAQQFQHQTYSFFDTCGGVELGCVNDRGFFTNLIAGTTYVFRIADRESNVGPINFRIQAFEYAPNDECDASETILVETANTNTYTADLRTATESLDASCEDASNNNYDLWFDFVMPVTGNLKIEQLTGTDSVTVYDACDGTELSCQSGLQFVSGLIENTNYLLRISSTSLANKSPRFQAFPIAVNDECETSETITIVTDNSLSYQVDTRRATETLDSSCDTIDDNNLDLWYDFVMPVTGNIQISGVGFNFRTTLYDACSGNELDCINGNGIYFNLGLNNSYKLRVSQLPNTANLSNLNIQAFENLFNDDCATPQNITVPTVDYATYSTNNAAATNSEVSTCEPSNETFTIQDVWYRFTMPNDNDVEIDHLTASVNGYYALYDSCGTTEIQCLNNDGFFTNLIGGNDYFLKVGKLSSQTGIVSFNISAKPEVLSIEGQTFDGVKLYPNPVKDILKIDYSEQSNFATLSIFDLNGRLVKRITSQNNTNAIDISDLTSSIYIVIIEINNRKLIQQIIKQ
ncbi:T9SS type A sorting domain-containing protein [Psychroserpens sp. AS72]|uniref:T9SS type A sorting domain-containing protein n=1 Tax=Psychroserpens sp. AS72 TaxID=3135775 RepID=UPI0031800372